MEKAWVCIKEAAAHWDVSASTVRRAVLAGELRAVRLRNVWRVALSSAPAGPAARRRRQR